MKSRNVSYLLTLLIALIVSSCNNDIFIESEDLPDITDIALDGNGDRWSSSFSRKGLSRIYVNRYSSSDDFRYFTYYGIKGGEVDADCPASELESIVYHTPLLEYSIGLNGSMIYISCQYNILSETTVMIDLEYDYGMTKTIKVTFTEGERIQLISWPPDGKVTLDEDFEKVTYRRSLTNNGSITQKLEITPFLDSRCSDLVMPEDSWAYGLILNLPMPTFTGKEWVWHEYADIRLGERRTFSPITYFDDKVVVDVPANTKAMVTYTLNYSRLTQKGYLRFYNPVEKYDFEEEVTWTSIYATSYEYTVDYE